MKVTLETDQLAVFDDVLEPAQLASLWLHVQGLAFHPVNLGAPASPWMLSDGRPMQAPAAMAWIDPDATVEDRAARYPTNTPIDLVLERLINDHPRFARWVGPAVAEWSVVTAVPWLYSAGSALSWHTDGAMYSGAYSFYVHPQWDPHWGGELVLAHESARHQRELEVDPRGRPNEDQGQRFHRTRMAELVEDKGIGAYVVPKPNRLVVIGGGHPHKIARIDKTAGNHVRASIAGFFVRARSIETIQRARLATPPSSARDHGETIETIASAERREREPG